MSNNIGLDKSSKNYEKDNLLYTDERATNLRVKPVIKREPSKFPEIDDTNIMEEGLLNKSSLHGLNDKERSLITNNQQKKGGSLKHKKKLSYKNKKHITRKMRKSRRNKKYK
uniref:Uncharacterized protein n=1 Tax=viral metagenome TaxID=1070528 RepID=A0A6C0DLZ6_9ZZZZ